MAGALMQLVAYGAQDVYLTGNPQITFFKVVYRRHTNFAMESMEQTLNGGTALGNRAICKLSRNGDLVGACYVEATLAIPVAFVRGNGYRARSGFNLLKNVELRIGGQKIDSHTGTWMDIWTELTHSESQKSMLDSLVGDIGVNSSANTTLLPASLTGGGATTVNGNSADQGRLQVPLQFSFCRNPGLALPLIALQYHEVEIAIDFATSQEMSIGQLGTVPNPNNVSLWADYMFLDTEERKSFAQNPHEYLIETVQENVDNVTQNQTDSVRLTFNHPVKELIWVYSNGDNSFGDYNGGITHNFQDTRGVRACGPTVSATLRLNGQDRFANRNREYFTQVQPYQHHTGSPREGGCGAANAVVAAATAPVTLNTALNASGQGSDTTGIHCYSFALKPEEHQPSGTCNFSRIDNAELAVTNATTLGTKTTIKVYAHGYNVLRVASGMGGLAYSN